jgi:hypothetical protein
LPRVGKPSENKNILENAVVFCCLMPNEQFFSSTCLVARTSYIDMEEDDLPQNMNLEELVTT